MGLVNHDYEYVLVVISHKKHRSRILPRYVLDDGAEARVQALGTSCDFLN